jgi:signal peptidase I
MRTWWSQNFGGIIVDGGSMKQTFQNGDSLLMEYVEEDEELKRGDVIIVDVRGYPECGSTDFLIKRLIAIEGDKIKCERGNLYICYAGSTVYEKEPLVEDYAYYKDGKELYSFSEYVVGEGEIFFLGDNRQNSMDSRFRELGGSHLGNRLYKRADVYGVVPTWAIEKMDLIAVLVFHDYSKLKEMIK